MVFNICHLKNLCVAEGLKAVSMSVDVYFYHRLVHKYASRTHQTDMVYSIVSDTYCNHCYSLYITMVEFMVTVSFDFVTYFPGLIFGCGSVFFVTNDTKPHTK